MVILITHVKFINDGYKRQDKTDKIVLTNGKLKLKMK